MDIIYIKGLSIQTIIGIFDWERSNRQTITIDLEMASDISKGAASEKIEDALDYKAVSDRLVDFVGSSSFQLIETLAESICQLVQEEFGVPWVKLELGKPEAVPGCRVGLVIERGSRPAAD